MVGVKIAKSSTLTTTVEAFTYLKGRTIRNGYLLKN